MRVKATRARISRPTDQWEDSVLVPSTLQVYIYIYVCVYRPRRVCLLYACTRVIWSVNAEDITTLCSCVTLMCVLYEAFEFGKLKNFVNNNANCVKDGVYKLSDCGCSSRARLHQYYHYYQRI